jgi:hypothetical protein
MTSSKSAPKSKPEVASSSKPTLVPPPTRPRDRLKLTAFPIHPFDQLHNVDTSGLVPAKHLITGHANDEHVTAYYGVAPSILRTLIARWRETIPPHPISSYTFIDIGAGKGRGLLVASEFHFRRVVGIELNPDLATIARHNVTHWIEAHAEDFTAPQLTPIEVLEQDALDYEFPSTPTLLFLFHPFEAPVLKKLLRRIETHFATPSTKNSSLATGTPTTDSSMAPSAPTKKSSVATGTRTKNPSAAADPSSKDSPSSPRPESSQPALDLIYVNAECADVLDRNPAFTQLFLDNVKMSPEDHTADIEAIARQKEYGSTGDEECAIYRYTGRTTRPIFNGAG